MYAYYVIGVLLVILAVVGYSNFKRFKKIKTLRAENKNLKGIPIPDVIQDQLEEPYHHGGHQWRWIKFEHLRAKRAFKATELQMYFVHGFDRQDKDKWIKAVREAVDQGKATKMIRLLDEFDVRFNLMADMSKAIQLAACHCVLDDENPTDYIQSIQDRKVKMIIEDPKLLNFFLTQAFSEIMNLGDLPDAYIQNSIRSRERELESATSQIPGRQYQPITKILTA